MLIQFLNALKSGEKTPLDLLVQCLHKIAEQELEVRAWVEVGLQPALATGGLEGIPFGVKDIFETRNLATEWGSALYEGRKGEYDAHVVGRLRRTGAVLLGKTRTTPFASFDSAGTRNPRAPGHTPGGSSSGSAAAVAAGMVPFAVGTQTLGSVLRPASFCGVCGFKPTYGLISMEGALAFAPSLDTVGFFAETAADMAALWTHGFEGEVSGEVRRAARLRLACDEAMRSAMDESVGRMRAAGIVVDDLDAPESWAELVNAAGVINRFEGARSHRERYERFGGRIGARLAELVRAGLEMPDAEYQRAGEVVKRERIAMQRMFREYPAILTPAAMGAPPEGYESTGDPVHNAPWTALGVPAIGVPMRGKRPAGMQITAAWDRDGALLAMARQVSEILVS